MNAKTKAHHSRVFLCAQMAIMMMMIGCSIHCPYCATKPPDGLIPTEAIHGNPPHTDKAGFRISYCNQTMEKPWTLPREAWTMNINAVEGSEEDSYRFNPWRCVR